MAVDRFSPVPSNREKTFNISFVDVHPDKNAKASTFKGTPISSKIGRFTILGALKDSPGKMHTLFLCKKPVSNVFTLEDEIKVTGYLSYSYLKTGTFITGVVFNSLKAKTTVTPTSLVVKNSPAPKGFQPSFNLEKLGALIYIASDSSVLVATTSIDSSLLIKVD